MSRSSRGSRMQPWNVDDGATSLPATDDGETTASAWSMLATDIGGNIGGVAATVSPEPETLKHQ
jgi:hypothetical protein